MSEKGTMKDTLCVEQNENSKYAANAIHTVLRRPYFPVGTWIYGYDTETGDVLVFFQLEKLYKDFGYARYHFLIELKKAWRKAGFVILEEKELTAYEYRRVSFPSQFFRLKRNYPEA